MTIPVTLSVNDAILGKALTIDGVNYRTPCVVTTPPTGAVLGAYLPISIQDPLLGQVTIIGGITYRQLVLGTH